MLIAYFEFCVISCTVQSYRLTLTYFVIVVVVSLRHPEAYYLLTAVEIVVNLWLNFKKLNVFYICCLFYIVLAAGMLLL